MARPHLNTPAGCNPGFDKALNLFKRNISAITTTAEAVAVAFGAPFLRVDFFVGSPKWGVRLNEVAYGCGCDYRNYADDGTGRVVDDAPVISKIVQEGMLQCSRKFDAGRFLSKLGVHGLAYGDSVVSPLPRSLRPPLPANALVGTSDQFSADCAMPDALCKTMRGHGAEMPMARSQSFHPAPAAHVQRLESAVRPRCYSFQNGSQRSITMYNQVMF